MGLATVTGICTKEYGCVIGEIGVHNQVHDGLFFQIKVPVGSWNFFYFADPTIFYFIPFILSLGGPFLAGFMINPALCSYTQRRREIRKVHE